MQMEASFCNFVFSQSKFLAARSFTGGIARTQLHCGNNRLVAVITLLRAFRHHKALKRWKSNRNLVHQNHPPAAKRQECNSSLLRARVVLGIKLCLVCRIVTAASRLVEAQHANGNIILHLCFFAIKILVCKFIYSKTCQDQAPLGQQRIRAVTALQRAFRRRQALKRWKSSLGIQKQEVRFCNKLQRFRHLLSELRVQENCSLDPSNSGGSSPRRGSPVSRFPEVVGDFLEEENAAARIQGAWRKRMSKFHSAAIKIQSCYRCSRLMKAYMKMRSAAVTIQNCLLGPAVLRRKKESLVNDGMKQLLVHRVRVLSAIVVQRWIRTIAAKKRFQKVNNRYPTSQEFESLFRQSASISGSLVGNQSEMTALEERDAAVYVSRWRRLQRGSSHRITSTFDDIVTELCEDHGWMSAKRRRRPPTEDQLFLVSSGEYQLESSSSNDSGVTNDSQEVMVEEFVAETAVASQNKAGPGCKKQVVFQIQYVQDNMVKVTETDTGVEMAVETEDVLHDVQCCGFEVMPS